jgi:hypothetical protein
VGTTTLTRPQTSSPFSAEANDSLSADRTAVWYPTSPFRRN